MLDTKLQAAWSGYFVCKRNISSHLLSRDGAEGLQVAQLQRGRGLLDDVRRILQSPTGLLLSLRRHNLVTNTSPVSHHSLRHLGPGLPGGLRLRRHDALHLARQPHVLDLHPLHVHAPGVGRHLQAVVHRVRDGLPIGQDVRKDL